MVYDDRRFYFVNMDTIYGGSRQVLRAVSLEDGSHIWSRACRPTGKTWPGRSRSRSGIVIAYPATIPRPATISINCRRSSCPVIVRQRETGELVQRFVFPTTIADLTSRPIRTAGLVATTLGLWGLGSKEASPATSTDRGH